MGGVGSREGAEGSRGSREQEGKRLPASVCILASRARLARLALHPFVGAWSQAGMGNPMPKASIPIQGLPASFRILASWARLAGLDLHLFLGARPQAGMGNSMPKPKAVCTSRGSEGLPLAFALHAGR